MAINYDAALEHSRNADRPDERARILERLVQIGTVISVSREKHAARVRFEETGIISGWLKIVDTRPYIPDYEGGESEKVRWEGEDLFGETEEESCASGTEDEEEPAPEPEVEPEPETVTEGEGTEDGGESGEGGGEEEPEPEPAPSSGGGCAPHSHELRIRMWIPKIDDRVLCLFLPVRNGDGFILGKIW